MSPGEILARLLIAAKLLTEHASALDGVLRAILALARRRSAWSYTNRTIEVVVDLDGLDGRRALIRRFQEIRFHVQDPVLVRDVVWGEGRTVRDYEATGARILGMQQEGASRTVALTPTAPARAGTRARFSTRRVVEGGFRRPDEYYELMVERPTERVRLRVMFPKTRPPLTTRLVVSPPPRALQVLSVRHTSNGRPYVSWGCKNPHVGITYRLAWTW